MDFKHTHPNLDIEHFFLVHVIHPDGVNEDIMTGNVPWFSSSNNRRWFELLMWYIVSNNSPSTCTYTHGVNDDFMTGNAPHYMNCSMFYTSSSNIRRRVKLLIWCIVSNNWYGV